MNVQPDKRRFLGTGWKFPLQVTPNGRIAQARAEQRVEESILLILATARGERPMLPDFGCGMHDLVFAPNSASSVALVVHLVRAALVKYEPRVDVLDVHAESTADSANRLLIRVNYRIRATNAIGNLVYPFYVTEGR
ncbi:MAG: GPW/gp25 family protein [Gammaproteobacteria bacterium]|nr:GPW/gp25 family protein [Gammaproteobacteria bacterium]MDH5274269.1 GPW/gp25 family protein [Gammaproteobacteria bacterium]